MSEGSRHRIFSRLRAATRQSPTSVPQPSAMPIKTYSQKEKLEKLKTLMEAMRTEVYLIDTGNWVTTVKDILKKREIKSLLYAHRTAVGETLARNWGNDAVALPQLIPYETEIEQMKERVFIVEAGITSTAGAIAETGALILWPTAKEPRLMSIVPPLHIAVLQADKIYNSFSEVMQKENWPAKMPTNVVLVSGPSKTADIEMTLAFGVHGPKELIVLIVDND